MNVDSCFFSLIESLLPNCFIENIWPKSKLLNERTELVELKNISKKYIRVVITLRRAYKWAQNELNLRLKVISFAIMTPSEQFYVS